MNEMEQQTRQGVKGLAHQIFSFFFDKWAAYLNVENTVEIYNKSFWIRSQNL